MQCAEASSSQQLLETSCLLEVGHETVVELRAHTDLNGVEPVASSLEKNDLRILENTARTLTMKSREKHNNAIFILFWCLLLTKA